MISISKNSSSDNCYRYVDSSNRGIMSDYYLKDNIKLSHSVLKKLKWLPSPNEYNKDDISYFTELGNKKFKETSYNDFKKYIPNIKIKKYKVKDIK